jgi:hypothetical protein
MGMDNYPTAERRGAFGGVADWYEFVEQHEVIVSAVRG